MPKKKNEIIKRKYLKIKIHNSTVFFYRIILQYFSTVFFDINNKIRRHFSTKGQKKYRPKDDSIFSTMFSPPLNYVFPRQDSRDFNIYHFLFFRQIILSICRRGKIPLYYSKFDKFLLIISSCSLSITPHFLSFSTTYTLFF